MCSDVTRCPTACDPNAGCGGCIPLMITDFRQLYTAFGVIFVVVSAIMIITLVFTFCLMSGIAKAAEAKKPKKGGKR